MLKGGKTVLRGIGIALIWLAVWQAASMAVSSEFLLPSPVRTVQSLIALMGQGGFWGSALASVLRVVAGYLAAVILGTALGAFTSALPFADALLRPLRSIIKATPVTSFILLVWLWMKTNTIPAFTAFLMVLPLIWANVQEGIRATDAQLLEMAKLFRFGRKKTLRMVYLPSVLPHLLAACATGLGFAWKASVAAEVLVRTANSIGKNLIESKNDLETADMFAWTAVVIALSILLERLFVRILKRIRNDGRWGKRA